ncbi:hypothetical protein J4E85_007998 [Alternaria conjuncta]|uniref:uncharacterized protein n=1 Tax=Alternaria conjuncta TaxID=181017 RepID=UPI002220CDFE|nr:uncharacterized protein J4E85_007998 [Alternaria conjuncta]KAI4923842.1 hypothetical protein J4E85_007998 [Alternaria conjuncta]
MFNMKPDLLNVTASELQRLLTDGRITSLDLVRQYHNQIFKHNDRLKAMISISPLPHLEMIAVKLDDERRRGVVRSALHGIPFIVKDAMDTSSEFQLESTNGGWAFVGSQPRETARVVRMTVDAGMILMGKANLSQFGNWKASGMSGGWSARGGQTQSAYVRGGVVNDGIYGHSNPSGSSTGSAVAVSAGFAPVSIGADFNGSLTNPATRAALFTIRTTPGIVSEHGAFPFSKNRDSVGPMAKSVEDLVGLLNVVVDLSHSEVPDRGYNTSLSRDWKDISFGTLNPSHWRLPEAVQKPQPGALDQIIRETLAAYKKISTLAKLVVGLVSLVSDETLDESMNDVLATIKNDFSTLFEAYTNGLVTPKVKTLAELINFNETNRDIELPDYSPRQDKLTQSLEDANSLTDAEYHRLDVKATASAADDAIDKMLREHNVNVIIGPADSRLPDVVALASRYCRVC